MSLAQKYTWQDFLKEFPEHRKNKLKRTSAEGKKAYEAAYKNFIKKYLSQRGERLEKMVAKATTRRNELATRVQALRKAKKYPKATLVQVKAGRADAAIASLKKQQTRNVAQQKNI